ncbi:MAG: 4Fe-4S binding protein [Bacteroidales bacterium]
MNNLKSIRITLAVVFFTSITLLVLDFTGTLHRWLDWMARIQLIPAILALNVGVVVLLFVLTLLFGRIYCSVICPLGVFQDLIGRLNPKKHRFSFSNAKQILRILMLILFVAMLIAGIGSVVALLEPYSIFGRMVSNLLAPLWQWANNLLALLAERANSYAFYRTDVWIRSIPVFVLSFIMPVIIAVLAWRNGRIYCNTICPVGTILGFLSKISFLKPQIDTKKCNSCGLCARNCKASCIDATMHRIDYSRCVTCFDCLSACRKGAIRYESGFKTPKKVSDSQPISKPEIRRSPGVMNDRRRMLAVGGAFLTATLARAQETKVDGGLAFITDKKQPKRQTPIVPPGSQSLRHFYQHCTGCQLCVSVCPNGVLRPSAELTTFMQPEMSYERGYCRPECTKCAEVCPAGAIRPVKRDDKTAIQVGRAIWISANCVVLNDNVACGNCARHCPAGAITMISGDKGDVPVVDHERCIGCGACENLCPSRPFSAIYVEGNRMHRNI